MSEKDGELEVSWDRSGLRCFGVKLSVMYGHPGRLYCVAN